MQNYLDILRVQTTQEMIEEQTLSSNICWFCDQPEAEKKWATDIYLFRNHTTKRLRDKTSGWKDICRKIPCCQICNRAHQEAERLSITFAWVGGMSGLLGAIIVPPLLVEFSFGILAFKPKNSTDFLGLVWFRLGLAILVGSTIYGSRFGERKGLSLSAQGKPKEYSAITPLVGQSWKSGKPN